MWCNPWHMHVAAMADLLRASPFEVCPNQLKRGGPAVASVSVCTCIASSPLWVFSFVWGLHVLLSLWVELVATLQFIWSNEIRTRRRSSTTVLRMACTVSHQLSRRLFLGTRCDLTTRTHAGCTLLLAKPTCDSRSSMWENSNRIRRTTLYDTSCSHDATNVRRGCGQTHDGDMKPTNRSESVRCILQPSPSAHLEHQPTGLVHSAAATLAHHSAQLSGNSASALSARFLQYRNEHGPRTPNTWSVPWRQDAVKSSAWYSRSEL